MVAAEVFTAAAIGYGQTQPYVSPLPALGYDLCEGVPCYLGMIAGLTSWVAANERIANLPATIVNPAATITRFSNITISGFLIANQGDATVGAVAVSPVGVQSEFPTLRDVLLFYGTPCNVYTEQTQDKITLIRLQYPHLTVNFPRVTQRLTLDRRAAEIRFTRVQDDQCLRGGAVRPWRGPTMYQRYLPR